MIDILPQIAHNYIAQAAFWGWFTAQAIKFVWQLVRHGKFRPERLVGSGGFPSSHTPFVIATYIWVATLYMWIFLKIAAITSICIFTICNFFFK